MDCSTMLESKIVRFTSFDDISYFLGSSNANSPQKLTRDFVPAFGQLLNQAIRNTKVQDVGVLVEVLDHIMKQDCSVVIEILISCGIHNQFGAMLGFAYDQVSSKKVRKSYGDRLFVTLLSITFQYAKKMDNKYEWFFRNMLHRLLEIIAEPSTYYYIRLQTVEMFLNIFSPDDQEVVGCFRGCIIENQEMYDMLCEKAFKNLSFTGDSQLQECIVELIFRMWSTNARNRKAPKWCDGNQQLLSKFLAISYDKFDYGVRMFLNVVNSGIKRRVLTLNYKELQVGAQKLTPSNQWCNCADFCYESKELSVRFPVEETSQQNNCSWNINTIVATNLTYFSTSENTAMRTIDLHLEFGTFTSQILKDFTLDDELATNLIIRFYRQPPLDCQLLHGFACTLFGKKYGNVHKHSVKHVVSRPKNCLIYHAESRSSHSQDLERDNVMNSSYISIPHANNSLPPTQLSSQKMRNSQRMSQAVNPVVRHPSVFQDFVSSSKPHMKQSSGSDEVMRSQMNASRSQRSIQVERSSKPDPRVISGQPRVVLERSQKIDSLSRPCTPSQVIRQNTMMNNLAIHAVKERQSEHTTSSVQRSFAKTSKHSASCASTASGRFNIDEPSQKVTTQAQELSLPKPLSNISQASRKSSQSSRKVMNTAISEDDSQLKKVPSHASFGQVGSTISKATSHTASHKFAYLDKSSKGSFSDTDRIAHKVSEFVKSKAGSKGMIDTRPLNEILRESGKASTDWADIIPETQRNHNISIESNLGDMSIDLMLSCLKPAAESKSNIMPQTSNAKSKLSSGMISVDLTRRVTRSTKKKASQKLDDSISPAFSSQVLSVISHNEKVNKEKDIQIDTNNNVQKEKLLSTDKSKTKKTASKVNAEFENLRLEFENEKSTGIHKKKKKGNPKKVMTGKENQKPGTLSTRKKRISLINTDIVVPLEDVSVNDPQLSSFVDNSVMKSIKKKPYAAKFIKSSTDASKSSKKSGNGKKQRKPTVVEIFKTDTEVERDCLTDRSGTGLQISDDAAEKPSVFDNVLKTLNIDQRPGGLEKARSEEVKVKKIQRGKRTKKPNLGLPFAEIEEIPIIENDHDNEVFQPIETVRDAPIMEDTTLMPSPEPIFAAKKKSLTRIFDSTDTEGVSALRKKSRTRILDSTDASEPQKSKRKRPRVSFHNFGLSSNNDDENEICDEKGKEKSKCSKKARLFDSTSSAASAASSDLSWIKEHKRKSKESPKLLRTYSLRKKMNSPLNLPSFETLTNNATMVTDSFSSSPEATRGGDVTNNSLLSGITRIQSLSSACNLTFDDIAFGNTEGTSLTKNATEISPVKLVPFDVEAVVHHEQVESPTYDQDNNEHQTDKELDEIQPEIDSIDLTAWDDAPVDEICMSTSDGQNKTQKITEKILPPKALELARLNNNTPVETSERLFHTRENFVNNKPLKRKADKRDSPRQPMSFMNNTEYKSKKKLSMSLLETPSQVNQTLNEGSVSHERSKKMIKLMGKYIRDVDTAWTEGGTKRDKYLQSFAAKAVECETRHNKLLKELKSLEKETMNFINKFNNKVDVVMTEAAKNIVEVKSTYSSLIKEIHNSNDDQNLAMEKLRSKIYDELKEIIQNSEC